MGSFLVVVEGMTSIADPSAFVKAEKGGITEAALHQLPTGHYLELEPATAPPPEDPESEAPHRAVIRLARPSSPRGGWPITPREDSLGARIAAARENEKENADKEQPSTDVAEPKAGW